MSLLTAAAMAATTCWAAPADAGRRAAGCFPTATPRGLAAEIVGIAETARRDLDLSAALVRVTVGGREVVTAAVGESMTGVPATTNMRFRIGAVGIAYMNILLLQLVDEGIVKLDDPIARWLPALPRADEVTLRMVGSSTSGYPDYVSYEPFIARFYADPFRHWTEQELIDLALARPSWYEPGTNWSYSHVNFVILGQVLERITGTELQKLLRRKVLNPLGLSATTSKITSIIPKPVLHSYTIERGQFEESTYWNPSWTTAAGAVLVSNICDLGVSARAVGTGRLISARALREQIYPGIVGLGEPTRTCPATICIQQTEQRHYGLGVTVQNGWIQQNASFGGYSAVQTYLPGEDIAIAVATTRGRTTTMVNSADTVANRIVTLLTTPQPQPRGRRCCRT
jgi:CubicO group peptidase (beta-lactamase class C family)